MYNNVWKHDYLWETEEFKIYVGSGTIMYQNTIILRHRRFQEQKTSMYNNASKHDHLWDTEDFKKNVHPCTIMDQNPIIY